MNLSYAPSFIIKIVVQVFSVRFWQQQSKIHIFMIKFVSWIGRVIPEGIINLQWLCKAFDLLSCIEHWYASNIHQRDAFSKFYRELKIWSFFEFYNNMLEFHLSKFKTPTLYIRLWLWHFCSNFISDRFSIIFYILVKHEKSQNRPSHLIFKLFVTTFVSLCQNSESTWYLLFILHNVSENVVVLIVLTDPILWFYHSPNTIISTFYISHLPYMASAVATLLFNAFKVKTLNHKNTNSMLDFQLFFSCIVSLKIHVWIVLESSPLVYSLVQFYHTFYYKYYLLILYSLI